MDNTDKQSRALANREDTLPAEPLFRPEVLADRKTQWLGTVLLAPKISHTLFVAFATLVAAAILGLLFFAEYTRKARINGWLVPEQGLVRIFAPLPGVVTDLNAQEGQEVRKGTPLLTLSTELQSEAMGATRKEIVRQLVSRRKSLAEERTRQQQLYLQQKEDLTNRLATLRLEQQQLSEGLKLQRGRLKLSEDYVARQRHLRKRGIILEAQVFEAKADRFDQALTLRSLEREWETTQRQLLELEGELKNLPLANQTRLSEIDREIAALEQELALTEAQRQVVIPAPQDGTVTAIQTEPGGSANTTVPLLSIVPASSKLQARLFSPSRAIGFVRPGQRVRLRYQAFPYQKFGHYEGVVVNVSRTAVSPSELTPRLSGLTSLYGANEPVYRITVDLESQTATAYGQPVTLQPGMQLEADVLIETRRLIEWVLDPLYTLTGRGQG